LGFWRLDQLLSETFSRAAMSWRAINRFKYILVDEFQERIGRNMNWSNYCRRRRIILPSSATMIRHLPFSAPGHGQYFGIQKDYLHQANIFD